MSDVTVSPTTQSLTVTPSVQSLTVTVPYSNTATVSSLDDLSDVALVGVANGYILRYNGTAWSGVPGSSYFAAASHTHPQSDVTGLVGFVSNTNTTLTDQADQIAQAQFDISTLQTAPPAHTHSYAHITSGYPALTYAQNILGTDNTSISTSAFTLVGTGLSLAAGTWLVSSTMTISHSSTSATTVIRIASSGGTVYASTEARNPATANQSVSESTCCVVVLGSTTTVQHECRTSASTATVKASTTTATSINATILTAVRIA